MIMKLFEFISTVYSCFLKKLVPTVPCDEQDVRRDVHFIVGIKM